MKDNSKESHCTKDVRDSEWKLSTVRRCHSLSFEIHPIEGSILRSEPCETVHNERPEVSIDCQDRCRNYDVRYEGENYIIEQSTWTIRILVKIPDQIACQRAWWTLYKVLLEIAVLIYNQQIGVLIPVGREGNFHRRNSISLVTQTHICVEKGVVREPALWLVGLHAANIYQL